MSDHQILGLAISTVATCGALMGVVVLALWRRVARLERWLRVLEALPARLRTDVLRELDAAL